MDFFYKMAKYFISISVTFSELGQPGSCFKSFWQVAQTLLRNASLRHRLKTQAGQAQHSIGQASTDGSLFLPSSLSLYRSGSELPLWLTFMSVRTSSGSRGCAGPLSSSFCNFFSYSLRVDAERVRKRESEREGI